ncbi:hypothetical protein PQR57_41040 [Paraburkholderia dipogonis]|uniref:Phosphoadenosine phosphosulphate reductase domain-containing protein n=1 Tax=Paraburkholderia dipogonis TaxID=1211383 RepID=A0ABW9B4W7_9BURK
MQRDILTMMESAIAAMQSYIERGYILATGLSGGKDSTCAMVLMLEAVRRSGQGRPGVTHYITSADTTIENPSVANFLHSMLDEVTIFLEDSGLPVEVHLAQPSLASQFVVQTIGRGTLVRTPENGVRDGKRTRACADYGDLSIVNRAVHHLATGIFEASLIPRHGRSANNSF